MGDEQPLNEKDFATVPLKPENPSHPPRVSDEVKNYYSKTTGRPDLFSKWFNIDLDSNVPAAKSYLNSPSTRNFVVDFGEKEAWCAPNLEKEDLVALLKTEVCCVALLGNLCLKDVTDEISTETAMF